MSSIYRQGRLVFTHCCNSLYFSTDRSAEGSVETWSDGKENIISGVISRASTAVRLNVRYSLSLEYKENVISMRQPADTLYVSWSALAVRRIPSGLPSAAVYPMCISFPQVSSPISIKAQGQAFNACDKIPFNPCGEVKFVADELSAGELVVQLTVGDLLAKFAAGDPAIGIY
ncbi:hypothetical protein CCACVL1_19584 [Corchorus capsularis]|uniref:Uncharacterized protein n=1 Tax=Corchorus capsularis TaxID=210143 RepID=A0A1R3HG18_COCAP|nr:hypothetical protein CCACVL1_19584 [Corchorus capsularis]